MTRYSPSPNYLWTGVIAAALAAFSGWYASQWGPAATPAFFVVTAALLFV
jgi:hypothetical protein